MKKFVAILLIALMLLPFGAFAVEDDTENQYKPAEEYVTANAVVESKNVYQITAPYSGVIMPFDWEVGDAVKAGETLFRMDTTKVYAPADGKIVELFAKEGDSCEDVMSQYGMIACLERTYSQRAACSTSDAYDDEENRTIHTGEKVYFKQSSDKDNQGEGRVISVNGDEYVVELTAGKFDNKDEIKIYRDEKLGTKTCIGTGKINREADMEISGAGRVVRCLVSKDQHVKKGQLIFELAGQDAEADRAIAEINSPVSGAIEITTAAGGQQVYKGQVLAKVYDLNEMQIVAEVDEMDLDRISIGETVSLELDRYPGKRINATVAEIAKIGVAKQNATYYNVTLSVSTNMELLPGMNATVFLPAQAD